MMCSDTDTFASIHKALSPFASHTEKIFTIEPNKNFEALLKSNPVLFNGFSPLVTSWYQLQNNIFNALRANNDYNLIEKLLEYRQNDDQFPPDIVKSFRLFECLKAYQPSHIIEMGCGTSTKVINEYINVVKNDCNAISIDNNSSWLDLTRSKIKGEHSNNNIYENHEFYCSYSESNTIKKIHEFILKSEKCFIFIDAKVIESDKTQGMDLVLKLAEKLPKECVIMIDARYKAVLALQELSSLLNIKIQVFTDLRSFSVPKNLTEVSRKLVLRYATSAQDLQGMRVNTVAMFRR